MQHEIGNWIDDAVSAQCGELYEGETSQQHGNLIIPCSAGNFTIAQTQHDPGKYSVADGRRESALRMTWRLLGMQSVRPTVALTANENVDGTLPVRIAAQRAAAR